MNSYFPLIIFLSNVIFAVYASDAF